MISICFVLCIYFALKAVAVPNFSPPVHARDAAPTTAGINAAFNVTDGNGVDITPSIQIMVYQESQQSTDGSLNDRQVTTRLINQCVNSTFLRSYCTPLAEKPGSLQSWTLVCQQTRRYYRPGASQITGYGPVEQRHSGKCNDDEICINRLGLGRASEAGKQMAMCVRKSTFDFTMYGSGHHASKDAIDVVLDKNADGTYMVMSESDSSTAMEVGEFDVYSWIDSIMEDSNEGAVRRKRCKNCMDLESWPFAPDTNAMKAEASLLAVGTAAATGILWLAMLSG